MAPPSTASTSNLAQTPTKFDVGVAYRSYINNDEVSAPLAAILSLADLVEHTNVGTMFELVSALNEGATALRRGTTNPIGLDAGCELFIAFVTLFPHESDSFEHLKTELVKQGRAYAKQALTYRTKIAELLLGFIKDDSVIMTHSYSRVVIQALLLAHRTKRISVYVTEARPRGLGVLTSERLAAAGIPCTVILDSAVAYAIDKVDMVLVGSEAVVESGGLVNAVGSNQMAIIAQAAGKPVYAVAESYKFHRLFPLSQYDLPTHTPDTLAFPKPKTDTTSKRPSAATIARPSVMPKAEQDQVVAAVRGPSSITLMNLRENTLGKRMPDRTISEEHLTRNPEVDYTRPDLISLVFSDVGILTPEGVSQYLVGMFAG